MALKSRMRMYYGKEIDRFINSEVNVPNHILHSNAKILDIKLNGTSTNGETEIDPVDNKMQLSTAEKVKVVSSSADDNSSGTGHVSEVTVIGVADDTIIREQITMDDTDGTTEVESSNSYTDIYHAYASAWGSGDLDAAGTITVNKQDDTTICTIAAGANEGNGSGILVPSGNLGCILDGYLTAVGSQAANEGKALKIYINDEIDLATDTSSLNYIILDVYGYIRQTRIPSTRVYQEGTELTFFIDRIDDGNEDFYAHILFTLWDK